jgi:hypothetical protein
MYYYNEGIFNKNKEEDKEDDGLLSHGIKKNKKENDPRYIDYRNQQAAKGKIAKSPEGYKDEVKRKKRLKRLAALGAVAATGVGLKKMHDNKDEDKTAENIRKKQNAHNARMMRKQARINQRAQEKQIRAYGKQTQRYATKTGRLIGKKEGKKKFRDTKQALNESLYIYLYENFTESELLNYYNNYFNESKDKESYNEYKQREKAKGNKNYKSYKEWKNDKKALKKKVILGTAATLGTAFAGNEIRHKIKGDPSRANRKLDRKVDKDQKNRHDRNKVYEKMGFNKHLNPVCEELMSVSSYDMDNYLEALEYDENFKIKSYNSYCIMMESRGLEPLDENAFEQAKKHISVYTKAAINGIKAEEEKRKAKVEKMEKEKAKKKEEEKKKEAEKMKNMTAEEKKEYLREKRKKEEAEEEKKQDRHDLSQTFKQSLLRGSGEQLGKTVVKKIFN